MTVADRAVGVTVVRVDLLGLSAGDARGCRCGSLGEPRARSTRSEGERPPRDLRGKAAAQLDPIAIRADTEIVLAAIHEVLERDAQPAASPRRCSNVQLLDEVVRIPASRRRLLDRVLRVVPVHVVIGGTCNMRPNDIHFTASKLCSNILRHFRWAVDRRAMSERPAAFAQSTSQCPQVKLQSRMRFRECACALLNIAASDAEDVEYLTLNRPPIGVHAKLRPRDYPRRRAGECAHIVRSAR